MKKPLPHKPNLVFIVASISYEGISKQVLLQIEALLQIGYQIKLIVLTQVESAVLELFAPSLHKNSIVTLNQPDAYLSARSLKTSLTAAWLTRKILIEFSPKVVFAHAPYAQYVARLATLLSFGKLSNTKLWEYFHSLQYQEYPLNTAKRVLINSLNKLLASKYDHGHIYVSKAVRNDVNQHLINLKNKRVIYNALPSLSQSRIAENKAFKNFKDVDSVFTIMIPGRLEKVKGQLWFLDVFHEFIIQEKLKSANIKLIIAGGGSDSDKIHEKIKEYNLGSIVNVTGPIDNAKNQRYLIDADLVIIPSLNEGFGLVVLEALMNDKTILSSDAGGLKEILEHNKTGFMFTAEDAKDCISKLNYIYNNRGNNLIDKLAVNEVLNSKFSFEKHIQEITSVIENG